MGGVDAALGNAGVSDEVFSYTGRMALNAVCLFVAECSMLLLSLLAGGLLRWWWKGDPMFSSWMPLLLAAWLIGASVSRLIPGWGLGPVEELRRSIIVITVVFLGTTAMLFWGRAASEASRLMLATGFLFSLVSVPLARTTVKRQLLRAQLWGCPTVIYGDSQTTGMVAKALREEPGLGYVPYGIFLDNPALELPAGGLPVLGGIGAHTSVAPIAMVALPRLAREAMSDLLEGPLRGYRKIVIIPDFQDGPSLWVKPRDLVGMLGLEISINLLDPFAQFQKRAIDLIVALLTAPLWAPLCLVIALLVWLEDRDNPFFAQPRIGRGGREFKTWKFRTMHLDAERILEEHLEKDPDLRVEWQAAFKLRRDPRVTRIGAILRRTSLDELPQLVNVVRGEMSLVGPRPLPAYHNQQLSERVRKLRDRVRPGVTGLWQVSGRSESGHLGMARWDTYYVRNWSFWLDVVILVRTIRTVISGHGAF